MLSSLSVFRSRLGFVSLLVLGAMNVSAQAAQANEGGAASPRPAPSVGPLRVTEAAGGIGSTEQGFSLGGRVGVETNDILASLDLSMGQPILRVRGHVEGYPVRLVRTDLGNGQFDLQIVPLNGDVQASLAAAGQAGRHFIQISPEIRARYRLNVGGVDFSARAIAAPVTLGAARDGDGSTFFLSTRVGAGLDAEVQVNPETSVALFVEGMSRPSWLAGLEHGGEVRVGAQVNFWTRDRHQYFVRAEHVSNRFDVRPSEGANSDSGGIQQTMLFVGARF
jgi:hypothetical protein